MVHKPVNSVCYRQEDLESLKRRSLKRILAVSLGFLTATHLWGVIFAGSIFICSLFFLDLRRDRDFFYYSICSFIVSAPFIGYLIYHLLSASALAIALADFRESALVGLDLFTTMGFDFQEAMFRTVRSKIIFVMFFALLLGFGGTHNFKKIKYLVFPVMITLTGVAAGSYLVGSIYKSYVTIVFVPFMFMALSALLSSKKIRTDISALLFVGFVAANFGSVPLLEGKPEKPGQITVINSEAKMIDRFP